MVSAPTSTCASARCFALPQKGVFIQRTLSARWFPHRWGVPSWWTPRHQTSPQPNHSPRNSPTGPGGCLELLFIGLLLSNTIFLVSSPSPIPKMRRAACLFLASTKSERSVRTARAPHTKKGEIPVLVNTVCNRSKEQNSLFKRPCPTCFSYTYTYIVLTRQFCERMSVHLSKAAAESHGKDQNRCCTGCNSKENAWNPPANDLGL